MNQNLLIVDDELGILGWLEELFKFHFDMEIGVYTASSAIDALELLDRVKFDVVLTDIKMPGMDGITLFERIKSNWPRCKTVFLTGYRDFDDMYRIINHKDVRYVLKSEEDEVIEQAVRESFLEVRRELEQEAEKMRREEELGKAREALYRSFMEGFLAGEFKKEDVDRVQKKAGDLKIPVNFCEMFLVFLIRMDTISFTEGLEEILKKNLPQDINTVLYPTGRNQAVFLIQPQTAAGAHWKRVFAVAQGAVEYAQIVYQKKYGSGFSAVISSNPVSQKEVPQKIIRLKQIMVGYLGGESEVIAHEEVIEKEEQNGGSGKTHSRIPQLRACLEMRKKQEYFQTLMECTKELTEASSIHDTHAIELYYSVAVLLLQFINENELNEKIAFETGLYKLTKVDEHASWFEAARYLSEVSDAVFRLLDVKGNSLSEQALKRVTEYIDSHLAGDLSLTRLADVGGFNASYLSRLFKQVYKTTVSDYVSQKRMYLAAELLVNTSLDVQEIAIRTGYVSPASFGRTFRGWSGVSPKEYREKKK